MTYPDAAFIAAVTAGMVAIIGAVARAIVVVKRETRKLHAVLSQQNQVLDDQKGKLDSIDRKANGNFKRMQEQLDKAEKRAIEAEQRNAELMGIIGAIRPLLNPKDVADANIKTRLSDADTPTNKKPSES